MVWNQDRRYRNNNGHLLALAILSLTFYTPQVVVSQTVTLEVVPASVDRDEGAQLLLICKNSDDSIPASIKWRLPNGVELGPDSAPEDARVRNSHHLLDIDPTERGDSGDYTCIDASSSDRVAISHLEVTVPPKILNRMPVQEIRLGETVLIRCEVDRGNPLAEIGWYRNEVLIDPTKDDRLTFREDGLEITAVEESDEGEYECYADNADGFDRILIQVAFTAPPQFINPNLNTDVVIRNGETLDLDCSAAGAPSPNYTWVAPPTSKSALGPVNRGPILRIAFTETSDSGPYTCTVSNGIGEITRTLDVTVVVPPKPTLASHNRTISLGLPVTLDCRAEAHPPPSYTWFLSSSDRERPLTDTSKYVQSPNGTLRVSRFETSDFDDSSCQIILLCSAENDYGVSRQYYTLSLDHNGCATILELNINTPSEDPKGTESGEGESGGKKNGETILIGVFSGVLLCLAVAVVLVFMYLVTLCHRSHLKNRSSNIESANSESSADTCDFTTNAHQAPHHLPPRNVPRVASAHPLGAHSCSTHTWQQQAPTSNVHSGNCGGDVMDDGSYSKLNHLPVHTRPRQSLTRSSTSSTNSNSPLLQSQTSHSGSSGSSDDSTFTAESLVTASPLSVISDISTLPEQGGVSSQGVDGVFREREVSAGTHMHVQVMQPPQYSELRADTMDPTSHYETIQ